VSTSSPRFLPSVESTWSRDVDVVVVGSGAAGLSAALAASEFAQRVVLVSKGSLRSGSTPFAQGGLAVVSDADDSFDAHAHDTLVAAAGLADADRVRSLVTSAPGVVKLLKRLGAHFDLGALGLEGGHSHRRIVHAGGDAIGAELHRVLHGAVLASDIEIMENTVAIDALIDDGGDVVGLLAGRVSADSTLEVGTLTARAVVLATGGYGQAFASSTNPAEVTGDGLALAFRAGATVSNVEFVQFHPTVLYSSDHQGQSPLITEALRGAGGSIVDGEGRSVMRGAHPLGDLAPRDVVSFTMLQRMNQSTESLTHLWLDARSVGAKRLTREFPTTLEICRRAGIDPASEPIPVAPGAHYACGGVSADLDGNTSLAGLYAVGEVATTGVHGANRLASNSLTEAVIAGRRLGQRLAGSHSPQRRTALVRGERPEVGRGVDASTRRSRAASMSTYAGVLRHREGLETLLDTLATTPVSQDRTLDLATLEATNLHTASLLVTRAALLREESRGCHRRSDFVETSDAWGHEISLRLLDGDIVADAGALAGA
jgi:L-aspartate oxidase